MIKKPDPRGALGRVSTFLWSWPRAVLAATVVVLLAANVVWLWRFRYGFPLDVDEAGYLSTALDFTRAFESGGLGGLWEAVMLSTPHAPLVPLLTVPFQLLFGYRVFPGFLLQECFFALLVFSSYGIGRRLTTPTYGALTAVAVATIPLVTDYTRHYIFAIDNTALVAAAVFALLASDRLGRRGWALLFGVLLGLALLARTMTLGFVPGVVAAAVLLVVTARDHRGARAVNLGLGFLVGVAVAATWYGPHLRSVLDYLLGYGYGNESSAYGQSYPLLSWHYWTFEIINAINNGLYVPLAAVLAVSSVLGLFAVVRRHRRGRLLDFVRAVLGHEATAIAVVVGAGYLVLSSTSNTGTGFPLPLLPLVVALGVALLWRVDWRLVRVPLMAGLVTVSLLNAVMKADLAPALSAEGFVTVPLLGAMYVTDGRGQIQRYMENQGYEVGPATSPMPRMHRRWLPVSGEVANFLFAFSAAHGRFPVPYLSSYDPLFNGNTLRLAASLQHRPPLYSGQLSADVSDDRDDRVAAYREVLSNPRIGPGLPNFLITADPAPVEYSQSIDPSEAEGAARSLDFKLVKTVAMPGGREVRIWWLDRGPAAPKAEMTNEGEGGSPESKIAHLKQGTYTLNELPPPEPVSEDVGLQNVDVGSKGDMFAHPPSGAAFTIENKRQPVSLTFTPSFLSDVPVDKTDGVTFEVWSGKERLYQKHVLPDDSIPAVTLDLPEATTKDVLQLSFVTRVGPAGNRDYDWALWRDVWIVVGEG